jgi:hypothetical protein
VRPRRSLSRLAWLSAGAVGILSCRLDPAAPGATVFYAIDAPLCSSRIPVQFSIDSALVGTDTFAVNISPQHTTSRGFATTAGSHTLGARVVGGLVWPDRAVTLTAGEAFTDSLPFYCS